MDQQRCGNCRFFVKRSYSTGTCHESPPRTRGKVHGGGSDLDDHNLISERHSYAHWPAVGEDEWCGRWSPGDQEKVRQIPDLGDITGDSARPAETPVLNRAPFDA